MTPEEFEGLVKQYRTAIIDFERCEYDPATFRAEAQGIEQEVLAEYKRVYALARELAEALYEVGQVLGVHDPGAYVKTVAPALDACLASGLLEE